MVLLTRSENAFSYDFKAINVFTLDEVTFSPCSLYILYILKEQMEINAINAGSGVSFIRIRINMGNMGFSEEEIHQSMKILTEKGCRLIYSSVDDSVMLNDGRRITQYDDQAIFYLSWAGENYLKFLIPSAVYCEYIFPSIESIRNSFLYPTVYNQNIGVSDAVDRFKENPKFVVKDFQKAMTNLYISLNIAYGVNKNRIETTDFANVNVFSCFCPVIEVFFTVLKETIDIITYIISRTKNTTYKDSLNDLLVSFKSLATEHFNFLNNINTDKAKKWNGIIDSIVIQK